MVVQWLRICQSRGHKFDLWFRKIPRAMEVVTKPVLHSYWAYTALEPMLCNKKGDSNEKPMSTTREQFPLTAIRESPRTAVKTQATRTPALPPTITYSFLNIQPIPSLFFGRLSRQC